MCVVGEESETLFVGSCIIGGDVVYGGQEGNKWPVCSSVCLCG